ncbi:MAG: choice-of-anchor D domain-containing protein [Terriglobales bacterium]
MTCRRRKFVHSLAFFFGGWLLLTTVPVALLAQSGQWVWVGGSNQLDQAGSYGTQGTFSANNLPGARGNASVWKDAPGRMWFFGGAGMIGPNLYGCMDDLWIFDPAQGAYGEWTWQAGPQNPADFGVTGPQGQFSDQYVPAARLGAMSWLDKSGRLWLFGGWIYSGPFLGDMWVFDPTKGKFGQWAWMASSLRTDAPGVYGTLGQPASANSPGARGWGGTWTDSQGNLWLFGGGGVDGNGNGGWLNDIWVFQPSAGEFGEWSWVGGSSTAGPSGIYGTQGNFAAANIPGGRNGSALWSDSQGNIWLFGGMGVDAFGNQGNLADMWQFDPSVGEYGEWAFMGGSEVINGTEVSGTPGVPAPANLPEERNWAQFWKDSSGNFWLYGGDDDRARGGPTTLNDVWVYSPTLEEWAEINAGGPVPNYGTEYVAAPSNFPGERDSGAVLTVGDDDVLIFGGRGVAGESLGDLWQYTPAPTAIEPAYSVPGGIYPTPQSVTITTATAGATIYYTTDGSIPSTGSNLYTGPVTIAPGAKAPVVILNAIAVASGYLYSPMQSATYVGASAVSLSPTSLNFGSEVVNNTSSARRVILRNSGTGTLNISSITASASFAVSSTTCGATLVPSKTCGVSVTFTATILGSVTGTLTFTDNATNSPQAVALSGTGIEPATLTPANATYAKQKVGTTSAAKTFTLMNEQPVALTGIKISTTGDFALSATTCTTTLSTREKCAISVTFRPTETGTRTGELSVSDSASTSPQAASLTGTGD